MFPFVIRPLSRLTSQQLLAIVGLTVFTALSWRVYAANALSNAVAEWTLRTPVFRFWEFLLGVALGLLLRRGMRLPGRVWMVVATIGLWIIIFNDLRPRLTPFESHAIEHVDQVMAPLLFAWLLGVAAGQDLSGRRGVLASKPLVLLGAWSYAFYLVQFFPLNLATHLWGRQEPSNDNIVDVLVLTAIVTGLAALLYYTVERPTERWLRSRPPRLLRYPS